jgi:hypothetical protein
LFVFVIFTWPVTMVVVGDDASGALTLRSLRGPTDDELLAILDRVEDQIGARLAREAAAPQGGVDDEPPDLWSSV